VFQTSSFTLPIVVSGSNDIVLLRPDTSRNVTDVCGVCGTATAAAAAAAISLDEVNVGMVSSSALWSTRVRDVRTEAFVAV
jgi:hypothetical protein